MKEPFYSAVMSNRYSTLSARSTVPRVSRWFRGSGHTMAKMNPPTVEPWKQGTETPRRIMQTSASYRCGVNATTCSRVDVSRISSSLMLSTTSAGARLQYVDVGRLEQL